MPRLHKVSPDSLLDDNGVIDPLKCWSVFMQNEKPGGHGDRAVAAGALDMAFWDVYAKAYQKPLGRFFPNSSTITSLMNRFLCTQAVDIIIRVRDMRG